MAESALSASRKNLETQLLATRAALTRFLSSMDSGFVAISPSNSSSSLQSRHPPPPPIPPQPIEPPPPDAASPPKSPPPINLIDLQKFQFLSSIDSQFSEIHSNSQFSEIHPQLTAIKPSPKEFFGSFDLLRSTAAVDFQTPNLHTTPPPPVKIGESDVRSEFQGIAGDTSPISVLPKSFPPICSELQKSPFDLKESRSLPTNIAKPKSVASQPQFHHLLQPLPKNSPSTQRLQLLPPPKSQITFQQPLSRSKPYYLPQILLLQTPPIPSESLSQIGIEERRERRLCYNIDQKWSSVRCCSRLRFFWLVYSKGERDPEPPERGLSCSSTPYVMQDLGSIHGLQILIMESLCDGEHVELCGEPPPECFSFTEVGDNSRVGSTYNLIQSVNVLLGADTSNPKLLLRLCNEERRERDKDNDHKVTGSVNVLLGGEPPPYNYSVVKGPRVTLGGEPPPERELWKKLRRKALSQKFVELESIPAMVQGVWSNDTNVQLEVTTQFRKLLSIERSPPIDELITAAVIPKFVDFLIPKFVELLSSASDEVRGQGALGTVVGDSTSCRDLVLGNGALMPLLAQLNDNSKLSMLINATLSNFCLRNVTWTLSNLCRGKPPTPFEQVRPALPVLHQLIHLSDEEPIDVLKSFQIKSAPDCLQPNSSNSWWTLLSQHLFADFQLELLSSIWRTVWLQHSLVVFFAMTDGPNLFFCELHLEDKVIVKEWGIDTPNHLGPIMLSPLAH